MKTFMNIVPFSLVISGEIGIPLETMNMEQNILLYTNLTLRDVNVEQKLFHISFY